YVKVRAEDLVISEYRDINGEDEGIANVKIAPGEAFILGENADKRYKAKLENLSGLDVELVVLKKANNVKSYGFGLAGNCKTSIEVGRDEKVILTNRNKQEVTIRIILNRGVEGMRYEEID
ncbi:MAG: hypothetical protein AAFU03_12945, partial [Bacteroidota bacterium]